MKIKKGDRFELRQTVNLRNYLLRWGEYTDVAPTLHKGRFFVEEVRPDGILLSDADWDDQGVLTFVSTKHQHVVEGENISLLEEAIKGPKDWSPRKGPGMGDKKDLDRLHEFAKSRNISVDDLRDDVYKIKEDDALMEITDQQITKDADKDDIYGQHETEGAVILRSGLQAVIEYLVEQIGTEDTERILKDIAEDRPKDWKPPSLGNAADPAAVTRLLRFLERHEVKSETLDDIVHSLKESEAMTRGTKVVWSAQSLEEEERRIDEIYDEASKEASDINNGGLDAQVAYIVEQMGAKDAAHAIESVTGKRAPFGEGPKEWLPGES